MNALVSSEIALHFKDTFQVTASDLSQVLNHYADNINVLSLDCFDTLLWRQTATPKEVFYDMQQRPLFQSHGVTAYQRINAAARAYRHKWITHGHHQIKLNDIYEYFTSLNEEQQAALAEAELLAEMDLCYAYPPMVELMREAHARGLKIIIVSDTYLTENQLKRLLMHCLPEDVAASIDTIFCSCEFEKSKSDGLFEMVYREMGVPAASMLHIGDHKIADLDAPKRTGLHALHFIQFHHGVSEFLRIQHTAASLTSLSSVDIHYKRAPRYSLFRGMLSTCKVSVEKPETSIGYLSFGPALFAFARFITEEIAALRQAGKRPKVFFLLRDAYLLSRACEAYAGEPQGKLVRIRKFVAVAASFRTKDDVDHYLSSIAPPHFNMVVICEQLLLPREVIDKILNFTASSPHAEQTFYQLLHQPTILKLIFENSAAYRERLKRYMQKEMALEAGDTVMLVDTGYIGVTQEYLTRSFKDELKIEIIGRYFMGSHEPDRPQCKSLLTSSWCEHGLFEQSSTYKEGCVLDYDQDGNPIFDQIRLSDEQYAKVAALQAECLRFIDDAKHFFNKIGKLPSVQHLQEMAAAVLKRHIFFPSQSEIHYFQTYQHDKDMGADKTKTMFNTQHGLTVLRHQAPPVQLHPYEARSVDLNVTLSSLLQRGFDLDFTKEDMSLQTETIKIIFSDGAKAKQCSVKALPTRDGYYVFTTPPISQEQMGILFGETYQWVQIDSIRVMGHHLPQGVALDKHMIFEQLAARNGNLFECLTHQALLLFTPLTLPVPNSPYSYEIVYRPIIKR